MPEHTASVERMTSRRLRGYLTATISLSRAQALAGFVAAMLSIAGTGFGYMSATRITPTGDLLMFVRDRQTAQPVTDAIVEVLTPSEELVTTFPTLERNGARRSLKEGTYRVRVTNVRFAPEMRTVQVLAGQTSEIRFLLSPRLLAAPVAPAAVPLPPALSPPVAAKPATATKPLATKPAKATKPAATTRAAATGPAPHARTPAGPDALPPHPREAP